VDPEELSALTRNGEVLLTHPDMPDETPAAVMPESVNAWVARGWELYEAEVVSERGDVVTYKGGTVAEAADAPVPDAPPARNASTDEWRAYARSQGVDDADDFSRDDLRDRFTTTDAGADAAPQDKE
jgi:hypothetical protein